MWSDLEQNSAYMLNMQLLYYIFMHDTTKFMVINVELILHFKYVCSS